MAKLAAKPGWSLATIDAGGPALAGLVRAPAHDDSPWVLFFGGNGYNLATSQRAVSALAGTSGALGLATFAYRGYDTSEGTPSEKALESDAARIAAWLSAAKGVPPGRLFVVGHSLGAAVAASLDQHLTRAGTPPMGLVLLSPSTSLSKVAREDTVFCAGCLLLDKWPTAKRARDLSAPILLVHGSADTIIPVHHARDLARLLGEKATLLIVPGAGHNDLLGKPETKRAVRRFLGAPEP